MSDSSNANYLIHRIKLFIR